MPSINQYSDYRLYLRDCYAERKSSARSYSYRQFCLKAGITSPSLFREVVEGHRNLTESTIPAFAKGLGLSEQDTETFGLLVHYNQARDARTKQRWFEALRNVRRRTATRIVPLDHHEYFSRWYHSVLRELACLVDWNDDPAELARHVRPSIGVRETREALDLLQRLGFLRKDGIRWIQPDPSLSSGTEVDSLMVRACNRQFSELAVAAIDSVPPSQRDTSSLVVGISQDGFRRIKEEIRLFRQRIARIAEDDAQADRVFALSLQFVPHSVTGRAG